MLKHTENTNTLCFSRAIYRKPRNFRICVSKNYGAGGGGEHSVAGEPFCLRMLSAYMRIFPGLDGLAPGYSGRVAKPLEWLQPANHTLCRASADIFSPLAIRITGIV